jgi:O-antigen ligase
VRSSPPWLGCFGALLLPKTHETSVVVRPQSSPEFVEFATILSGTSGEWHRSENVATSGYELFLRNIRNKFSRETALTLNVGIQWGAIGIVVLYAMWLQHLLLFRGDGLAIWLGLMVVVQNIFTSLFNSHIFDFNEGWMYVLGVGVAGGLLKQRRCCVPVESVGERK